MSAILQPSTFISQLRNGCKNGPHLWNPLLAAKMPICCENEKRPLASFLKVINSLFSILTGHLNFKKVPKRIQNRATLHLTPPPEPSRAHLWPPSHTAMARTRWAKSSSPSSCLRVPRESRVQAATPEPPQPPIVPPPIEDAPMSPPMRRYQTRRSLTMTGASSSKGQKSGCGPPKKKVDATHGSLALKVYQQNLYLEYYY